MGARLMTAVRVTALPCRISDRARIVLMVMAHTALDRDDPPEYFGGSDYLAGALGFRRGDATGARAVRRALAELVEAGFIEQVPHTKRSHNRRWRLRIQLKGSPEVVDNRSPP